MRFVVVVVAVDALNKLALDGVNLWLALPEQTDKNEGPGRYCIDVVVRARTFEILLHRCSIIYPSKTTIQ